MTNFSLIEVVDRWMVGGGSTTQLAPLWGWPTQLLSFHFPQITQHYPRASLNNLKELFEGMLLVIVTSNLLSYPLFYSILNINKQNFTTNYHETKRIR